VDGTLVDSERHGHRVAFNLAFEEFGLPYRWDEEEYGELLHVTGGQRRLHHYLEEQGVDAEERKRLVPDLHARKNEIMTELIEEGRLDPRPGSVRLLSELESAGCALAVATTGSRSWVERLLDGLFGDTHFDVIVTGDDVEERKPDPEAFTLAVERLDVPADGVVVVEDSGEGLEAAVAAELCCAVVVNGYTADHELSAAALVLDGFGQPDEPARVLADPLDTGCAGVLDLAVLRRLVRRCRDAAR
jgi:HAD superfamily hydrolase (TIGR01509 family)